MSESQVTMMNSHTPHTQCF